jgi:glycosyltransferase involved in cell wall biosynthesis
VRLRFLHGDPTPEEREKHDEGHLGWAEHLPTRYFLGGRICWQAFGPMTRDADLVVITQENRLVYNFLALSLGRMGRPSARRFAFWGHGANLQSRRPNGLRERFKRYWIGRVDWWFAYTGISVDLVKREGFPAERITNLENAIDTETLRELCASVTGEELSRLRARLGLGGARVGLFLGSLYPEKRLPFLLSACDRIVQKIPGFHLLIAGEGPDRKLVEEMVRTRPWARLLGMQKAREKAIVLRLCEIMLNPGLVGLGILDAFVAGVPLLTTDCRIHSPEVAYLRSGENGLMTADSEADFAAAAVRLLEDDAERSRLAANACLAGGRYTIENMAIRFRDGILAALEIPTRR